jgi:ribosomal subunit interface protein
MKSSADYRVQTTKASMPCEEPIVHLEFAARRESMKLPPQITFRNMEPSEAMEQNIRERAEKLDLFYDHIMSCRVMVEAQHRHHHQGNVYHVRIDLTVPGTELAVSRDPGKDHAHEDVYVAIRDAFDAARRQLEDFGRRQRVQVKAHETPAHGLIARLYQEEDYGIIKASDGREIYFHRNSVVNADFDKLVTGEDVRFHEEMGDMGPQASTVMVEGKHHIVG